jgi:hypothetical protein
VPLALADPMPRSGGSPHSFSLTPPPSPFSRFSTLPLPLGRFDSFLGYFEGGEDYYDHTVGGACGRHDVHDLWYGLGNSSLGPANKDRTGAHSRPAIKPARSGVYSTTLYTNFIVERIHGHAQSLGVEAPLFVYAAYQGVHYPVRAMATHQIQRPGRRWGVTARGVC